MESTQDSLKYCLQIAKENGFLDLIVNKKKDPASVSPNVVNGNGNASPQALAPLSQQSDLSLVINQANINGWYIDPAEVIVSLVAIFLRFTVELEM